MSLQSKVQALLTAANAKTGHSDTNLTDAVQELIDGYGQGGGAAAKEIDAGVLFLDWDGTLLASWDASEVASKTSLPDNPDHSQDKWNGISVPLTADGWNYTLADIKAYFASYPDAVLCVGQMLHTTDGATRLFLDIGSQAKNPTFTVCPNGTFTFDFGDGSTGTVTGTSVTTAKTITHTYASAGKYLVKITGTGTLGLYGSSSYNNTRLIYGGSAAAEYERYASALISAQFGNHLTAIGVNALRIAHKLRTLLIPNTVTSIGDYFCRETYSLSCAIIPKSVTSIGLVCFYGSTNLRYASIPAEATDIGRGMFYQCYSLRYASIPLGASVTDTASTGMFQDCDSLVTICLGGISAVSNNWFSGCKALQRITIPAAITTISKTNLFLNCNTLKEMRFLSPTPPTAGTTTFPTGSGWMKIIVPSGTLAAYKAAANYPSDATNSYEET